MTAKILNGSTFDCYDPEAVRTGVTKKKKKKKTVIRYCFRMRFENQEAQKEEKIISFRLKEPVFRMKLTVSAIFNNSCIRVWIANRNLRTCEL